MRYQNLFMETIDPLKERNSPLMGTPKSLAENNGGKVLGSISKKLDFLVVGENKPTKKKIDIAKKLNIKIILEKEWNKILNS